MPRLTVDRERILRTLTFWLRPDFVLRVVNRFQRIAGFDRAIALASSALTALIPLLIFTSAILPDVGEDDAADEIIEPLRPQRRGRRVGQGALLADRVRRHEHRDLRRAVPAAGGAELHAHHAAAVRDHLGAAAAQRPQQPQRAQVDRCAGDLRRGDRRAARAVRQRSLGDRVGLRADSALGRVPDLVGIHPQRQANPLAGPDPVRRRRVVPARAVCDRRIDLRAPSARDIRRALRRASAWCSR